MSPRKPPTRGDQLIAAVRDVNRLTRERNRITRRLKTLRGELKTARAKVRAIMGQVGDMPDPMIAPSRLTAGATGLHAGDIDSIVAPLPETAGRIDDLEPFEK